MHRSMKLDGIHHVTAITGDAPANVEFYAGTLGLRLVKKSVNQDDPTVYHLFYADERAAPAPTSPSSSIRARRAVARATGWCTGSSSASPRRRRSTSGPSEPAASASSASTLIHDPEGLALELIVDDSGDEPLIAKHPEIPRGARPPRLRRRARLRRRPRPQRRVPRRARLHAGLGDAAASSAAASTSTTSRPRRAGCRAREPCTTSPGAHRWTSMRPGARR